MNTELIQLLELAMELDRKLTTAINMGWDTNNLYELIKINNAAIKRAEKKH